MPFYKHTVLFTLILLPASMSFMTSSHAENSTDKQRWQQLLEQTLPADAVVASDSETEHGRDISSDISGDISLIDNNSNNDPANPTNFTNPTSSIAVTSPEVTSISSIEASLNQAEQVFFQEHAQATDASLPTLPTARLDGSTETIGLDTTLVTNPNFLEEMTVNEPNEAVEVETVTTINPADFLPNYQEVATDEEASETELPATQKDKPPNSWKKVQNGLFGTGGVSQQPKVHATLYLQKNLQASQSEVSDPQTGNGQINQFVKVNSETQPYKNIQAALENIYQDTVTDFTAALPILKKTAKEAAEAVGYFDVKMSFQQPAIDEIAVIIDSVGEPVRVDSRVIDVRGEGENLAVFQEMEEKLPPLAGEVFNQGQYQLAKSSIESRGSQLGFFDSQWLNNSADVILPDNIADVDLIYDTGQRYHFDDVVFFTIDESTGQLTTDPNKLPVKQELLRQLVSFNKGDGYNRLKVNELRNDLATTRYFNSINVEEVMPADDKQQGDNTGITFESTAFDSQNTATSLSNSSGVDAITGLPVDVALVAFPNMPVTGIENLTVDSIRQTATSGSNSNKNNNSSASSVPPAKKGNNFDGTAESIIDSLINQSVNDAIDEQEQQTQRQLAAITFAIDDSTTDKYNAIETKASNLLALPDDRLLNERTLQAKSPLGKISNTVSSVAKAIFPEQKEPNVAIGSELPVLAGKKTPEQVKADKKVPLYVLVMSNKPYDAQIGLGYGTDTGFRTTAKLDNNLVNRDGYQAGVSAEWSNVEKKAGVYVSRPWGHPLDDTLSGSLSYEEAKINQGNADNDWNTKSVLAGISRNRFSKNNWSRSYSMRYRYDELDIGNDVDADPEDLPVRFNSSNPKQQALLLGYSMQKTTVDDLTNPKSGVHQRYSLEGGVKGAGTDTNMVIARAGASGIYSFGEDKRHQVIGKLNTGYMWADDFYDVPYTLRFFAGGDQSIRGYDYNSLSPVENGYLTGGQVLAVGSAEYNYEFKEGLRGAVFADVGNAYDKDFTTPTKLGVGFGIRWASPVGPVRVDVGAGVMEDSIPIRLHLFIGSPL